MRTISGGILGADQESTSTEDHTIRKTRISFELHPSAFIDDFLLADAYADDSLHGHADGISEEDDVKALNEDPHMNALASYLFGEEDLNSNIRVPRAA